jgi:hypothetical protein
MPNSQIDMVVMDNSHPGGWTVCGDFKEAPDGQVDVYVVVRQGDVLARGGGPVSGTPWQLPVTPHGGQLDAELETAIASAVAIGREDHSGLEVFTWAQRIPVLTKREDGNPPTDLSNGVPAVTPGTLAMGDSISSSLAVSEPTGPPAAPGQLSYTHDLRVHPAPTSPPPRTT